jgi:hypothetical protein
VLQTTDGYAAREALKHPLFTALATDREVQDCRGLLYNCALGAGVLPGELSDQLAAALHTSSRVIRRSIDRPEEACTIGQE